MLKLNSLRALLKEGENINGTISIAAYISECHIIEFKKWFNGIKFTHYNEHF